MTEPQANALLKPPQYTDTNHSLPLPKNRAISSYLPYARSNPSLSSIFASTSPSLSASRDSSRSTPLTSPLPGAAFTSLDNAFGASDGTGISANALETRNVIQRSFVPHIGVLSSADTDDMLRQKGFGKGFLEMLRPFGTQIQGKVTIRDSIGASRTFEDFGVRFTGLKDLLEVPRTRKSQDLASTTPNRRPSLANPFLAEPLRAYGGNVAHVEEVVDLHLAYSEMQPFEPDFAPTDEATSPFFILYLRKLLSAQPLVPHETFAHPVACVIAISSRNPAPIEELRGLYASTNSGDDRLPAWVNNEFLRYYVLVHDEEHDDIAKSTALYEQMKRHFGLHCHLLRVRSSQCLPSDDDGVRLPTNDYQAASEDLAEIRRRESSDDEEDPTPFLFESDVTALRSFVRELVTQSIVPSMERSCATWNEQVAARRRGIGGKLMSLSRKWTPFGSSSRNISSPTGLSSSSGGNYDPVQGFYRPDAPEALMRKLGDYAFMLRDFKLAHNTYDLVRSDFDSDKAWIYYAGANEMAAVASLMLSSQTNTKSRMESIDRMLEAATHSYIHRSQLPFYALRTLVLGAELLRLRTVAGVAAEDAARWTSRILDYALVGPIGNVLFTTRVASCHASQTGLGSMHVGSRQRKAAFWYMLAADSFMMLDKSSRAEECLSLANKYYQSETSDEGNAKFEGMKAYLDALGREIEVAQRSKQRSSNDAPSEAELGDEVEVEEVITEQLDVRPHRQSLIGATVPSLDGLEAAPLSPVKFRDRGILEETEEGFQ